MATQIQSIENPQMKDAKILWFGHDDTEDSNYYIYDNDIIAKFNCKTQKLTFSDNLSCIPRWVRMYPR